MRVDEVQINFDGMERSKALEDYLKEKLEKHASFLELATGAVAIFKQEVAARGVDNDFELQITVSVPKVTIHVEEYGKNAYALVDEVTDTLVRKLKRYHDKLAHWKGEKSWEDAEILDSYDDSCDVNTDYTPVVAVRKKIEDERPMYEAEAIEFMELKGFNQLLFKNMQTGKWSMLYKRHDGSYGLVEPSDDLTI